MIVIEKYLRFEGAPEDAMSFLESMKEIQKDNGIEFPKVFHDFLFNLEVAVRNEFKTDPELNVVKGVPRTTEDKRQNVLSVLNDPDWWDWSDREVAARCGVSAPFVAKIRKELEGKA